MSKYRSGKFIQRQTKQKAIFSFEQISQNAFQIKMAKYYSDPLFFNRLRDSGGVKTGSYCYKFNISKYELVLDFADKYLKKESTTGNIKRFSGDISKLDTELLKQYTTDFGETLTFKVTRLDENLRPVRIKVVQKFHKDIEEKVNTGFIDKIEEGDGSVKLSDIFPEEFGTLENPDNKKKYDISSDLWGKLYPFQRQGVEFGIKKRGRLLIADEMGVGKTIQALALSAVYRFNWPCLILCPSSLKFNWRDEIINWLSDFLTPSEIQILYRGSDFIMNTSKFVIVSYDLAKRDTQKLYVQNFGICIADEAHMLKSIESKRAKKLIPLVQSCKRTIILTGTPALSRPYEIFNLLKMIRPNAFTDHKVFGNRYCDPQLSNFAQRWEYKGNTNSLELNYVLNTLMIRRLKKDVLHFLPQKVRHRMAIETDPKFIKQIAAIKLEIEKKGGNLIRGISAMGGDINNQTTFGSIDTSRGDNFKPLITKMFTLSGLAKIKGICDFLDNILEYKSEKFIIFCHHKKVMEGISDHLKKKHKKVGFMMIRGDTADELREKGVKEFQTPLTEIQKENGTGCRIALLSITAASVGLTLTQSSTVIFAELYWTPALIIQAEDRAHRISQKKSVVVYYLMGNDTIDNIVYSKIKSKFNTLSSILDGDNAQQYHSELSKSIQDSMHNSRTISEFYKSKKEIKKEEEKKFETEEIDFDDLDAFIKEYKESEKNKKGETKEKKEKKKEKVEEEIDIDDLDNFLKDLETEENKQPKTKTMRVSKLKVINECDNEFTEKKDKEKYDIKQKIFDTFQKKKSIDSKKLSKEDQRIIEGYELKKEAKKRRPTLEDFFGSEKEKKPLKRGKSNEKDKDEETEKEDESKDNKKN